jgi:hypothetical protein
MLPAHEKGIRFRKLVNVHLETRGKTFGIPFRKVDKPGLFAARTATLAFKNIHGENNTRGRGTFR